MSDEGLYLLAADPPSPSASWGFPSGWHTHPLFALVGYDIASFRTLGAVVLFVAFAWLGWASARVVTAARELTTTQRQFLLFTGVLVGGLGSLFYYAPMLRTPSYNWLNLVGIAISAAAAISYIHATEAPAISFKRVRMALLAALSSVALFMTLPAKPSTLPLMFALSALLIVGTRGWHASMKWVGWNLLFLPVWLAIALATQLWPADFISIFLRALEMPKPDPLQAIGSAVFAVFLVPRDFASGLATTQDTTALLLLVSVFILLIPVIAARTWILLRVAGLGLMFVAALAVAGVPIPMLQPTGKPFGIANSGVTTASLIILCAVLLSGARLGQERNTKSILSRESSMRWLLISYLALLPFLFSFGSGNGIYAQSSLAVGFIFIAALVGVVENICPTRERWIFLGILIFVTGLMSVAAIVGGWQSPFRAAPLSADTAATEIGTNGATLLLEPSLSAEITNLRVAAEADGWKQGTPLVDVSYMWNPSVPYALGAQVPDSLALTIFGYASAHDIVDFHLSAPFRDFPFDQAWFLTSRPSSIADPTGQKAVDFVMEKLSTIAARPFPGSYACVSSGDFILWKPVSPEQGNGSDCEG